MKNKILLNLLVFSTLFSNIIAPVLAGDIELKSNKNKVSVSFPADKKTFSGGIALSDRVIEYKTSTPHNYSIYRHKEGDKEFLLLVPKLPALNYADKPLVIEMNSATRFHDCMTFLMLGGLSVTSSIERALYQHDTDYRFFRNVKNPGKSLKEGWEADDNAFWINYIGHPGEFFLLANYLKTTGASDLETMLFVELTNFTWEYVCEGNYVPPSPKDLIDDTLGALAGLYFYNKVGKNFMPQAVGQLRSFGYKNKIEFHPTIKYNSQTNGVVIGARIYKKI